MSIDLLSAADFMATHARVLDRRRFELLNEGGDPADTLAALGAYRNTDGGYGWGLEPDLRAPESQPGAAWHAFEVFEEVGPPAASAALALCDWLDSASLPDGGLPFALPMSTRAGSGPWWLGADPSESSLQITAVTAGAAHRAALRLPALSAHPWLRRATDYCLGAIESLDGMPFAYVFAFSVRLLDAVHETRPESKALLSRLGGLIPADGRVAVPSGTENEALGPLDLAPDPSTAARRFFAPEAIADDLARLADGQMEDGGWTVDFLEISPGGGLDWRGYATVRAIEVLKRNGHASPASSPGRD